MVKYILVVPYSSGRGTKVIKCREDVDAKQLLGTLITEAETGFIPRHFELNAQQIEQPELVIDIYQDCNSPQSIPMLRGGHDQLGNNYVGVRTLTLTRQNAGSYAAVRVNPHEEHHLLGG